jgi:hypothetical protein
MLSRVSSGTVFVLLTYKCNRVHYLYFIIALAVLLSTLLFFYLFCHFMFSFFSTLTLQFPLVKPLFVFLSPHHSSLSFFSDNIISVLLRVVSFILIYLSLFPHTLSLFLAVLSLLKYTI